MTHGPTQHTIETERTVQTRFIFRLTAPLKNQYCDRRKRGVDAMPVIPEGALVYLTKIDYKFDRDPTHYAAQVNGERVGYLSRDLWEHAGKEARPAVTLEDYLFLIDDETGYSLLRQLFKTGQLSPEMILSVNPYVEAI